MNDNDLRDLLQADADELSPLDPSRVIAGAHRRRRTKGVVAAGIASAAVAVVVAGGIYGTANQGDSEPFSPPVAGMPSAGPATPKPSASSKSQYVFQNKPQSIGSLAANGSVEIGTDVTFRLRGTQWALVSHVPGEDAYEPFGWRATVGNDNIGDGTDPGVQGMGAGKAQLVSSVFNCPKAATVVYTRGTKAWYAKIYRLGGIHGWVESSVLIPVSAPTGTETAGTITAGKSVTAAPPDDDVSVFAYDANGKLLASFGAAKDPLLK
jgi:hypothetical protein